MARDRLAVLRDRLAGAVAARGYAATAGALARLGSSPNAGGTTDLPVLGWLDDALYLPAGTIRWTHASDDAPAAEPAGVLVHHAPWQPHALWTDGRPVLLAYVWTGDVRTPAAFC